MSTKKYQFFRASKSCKADLFTDFLFKPTARPTMMGEAGGGIGGQLGRISLGEQKVPCHQTEIKERGTPTETLFQKFQDR